jgi:hypothetical protein
MNNLYPNTKLYEIISNLLYGTFRMNLFIMAIDGRRDVENVFDGANIH